MLLIKNSVKHHYTSVAFDGMSGPSDSPYCLFCLQLNEWVQEKSIIAQDETYRSAKTVHSKWTRHQAFEAEVQSNKDRLYQVQQVRYISLSYPGLFSLFSFLLVSLSMFLFLLCQVLSNFFCGFILF